MESSIEYYNEYITTSLAHKAKTDISARHCKTERNLRFVLDTDEEILESLFNKVPFSCNFNILNKDNYLEYISILDDPIAYIREYKNNQEQIFFIRISYIKKCAEEENQTFLTTDAATLGIYKITNFKRTTYFRIT